MSILEFLEEQIYTYFEENEVDGLFAVNELYAITAMKVARQKGLTIPDDLQVIGFTDGVLSKHAFPPLTTISQHGFEMGEESAKLLIDRLENPNEDEEPFKTIVVKTDIIDRETTKLHNPKK